MDNNFRLNRVDEGQSILSITAQILVNDKEAIKVIEAIQEVLNRHNRGLK